MASEFITEIASLWRKLAFLERLTHAMHDMIPSRIVKDEPKVHVDPATKQRIEDEIRSLYFERFDVENAMTNVVLKHRNWLPGKCFAIRHEKRWKFNQRELCKIISIDDKGRGTVVKAWKGKSPWTDDEEFSAYHGSSWDFRRGMDECESSEFDAVLAGIREILPEMIPESRHVDTTAECAVIGGKIRDSMKVLNLKDLKPTFEIMNATDDFIIENIDKFSGRCYLDSFGSFHAIIGTGVDKTFGKKYVKSIIVDQPSIESICGITSRLLYIGSFKVTPFTRVRQIPRVTFIENAFSVINDAIPA